MRIPFSASSLARAIWTWIGGAAGTTADRAVNVTYVDGAVWGTHTAGQVPADVRTITAAVTVTTNSDKTGYSLTAGSYSVRPSSTQTGAVVLSTQSTNTANLISSVTTTRATGQSSGAYRDGVNTGGGYGVQLASSTTVSSTTGANDSQHSYFNVVELF